MATAKDIGGRRANGYDVAGVGLQIVNARVVHLRRVGGTSVTSSLGLIVFVAPEENDLSPIPDGKQGGMDGENFGVATNDLPRHSK
jgi:hypothetical protein